MKAVHVRLSNTDDIWWFSEVQEIEFYGGCAVVRLPARLIPKIIEFLESIVDEIEALEENP